MLKSFIFLNLSTPSYCHKLPWNRLLGSLINSHTVMLSAIVELDLGDPSMCLFHMIFA